MISSFASLLPGLTTFGKTGADCAHKFLGLVPWYQYIGDKFGPACRLNDFQFLGSHSDFLLVLLAIIDDLLRIAALVAVGIVIWGGFTYMTSQGDPSTTAKAQKTVINGLVGLVIAILAATIVAFLGDKLGNF